MPECQIRTRLWRNGVLEKEDFPFAEISDYIAEPDTMVWADLNHPGDDEIRAIAEELSLDPFAVEDAMSHDERPKASRYKTHFFISAYAMRLHEDDSKLDATQVAAFMSREHRVMITVRRSDWFDIDAVVQRWQDNSDLMKYGEKALLWGLLDVMVDGYFEVVQDLDDKTEDLEELLFGESRPDNQIQRCTFDIRRSVVKARRLIVPVQEIVQLVMREAVQHHEEMHPYFEDLYDHVLRASENSDAIRDEVNSVFDTNLSLQDARLNVIMKKLTSYAAIVAIPTLITGWYGQNVPYPGFNQHWGFYVSTGIMLFMVAVLWVLFKRKDWL